MAEYLIKNGVPTSKILREGESKDTISNLYQLKNLIFIPKNKRKLLFVVAKWRIPRLKFLCERILGTSYSFDFVAIPSIKPSKQNEKLVFQKQKEFLEPMENGDHAWLDDKFFNASLYKYWAEKDKQPKA